jgi:3-oxoacyl-[acyl-carrier protein] reductase
MSASPRVTLITGAANGIGRATALAFAAAGDHVVAWDLDADRGAALVADISAAGGSAEFVAVDVRDRSAVVAAVTGIVEAHGRVDVLINNAGLGGEVPVVDMTDDQWHRVLDVTLTSVMRMSRAFLPLMYAAKSGVVVNNASVLGWRAQKGQAHYAAAKAGVMAFTRCSAVEAAEHNVRINAVAPSIAMHAFLAKVTTDDLLAELSAREAFGRPAEVWEVANVMLFLASDLSSYMTGEVVSVSSQRA